MNSTLTNPDIYGYFRMGLVTGIIDKQQLVNWADRAILQTNTPDEAIIELCLASSRPYSELVQMLSEFEGAARYGHSLNLLMAHAGYLLELDPTLTERLVTGLRVLPEEEYFPAAICRQIRELESTLHSCQQQESSLRKLWEQTHTLLNGYEHFRPLLPIPLQ